MHFHIHHTQQMSHMREYIFLNISEPGDLVSFGGKFSSQKITITSTKINKQIGKMNNNNNN